MEGDAVVAFSNHFVMLSFVDEHSRLESGESKKIIHDIDFMAHMVYQEASMESPLKLCILIREVKMDAYNLAESISDFIEVLNNPYPWRIESSWMAGRKY